jgi:hypothetical protein
MTKLENKSLLLVKKQTETPKKSRRGFGGGSRGERINYTDTESHR